MRQLKPVFFVFALLVLSATLAAADTAAPPTLPAAEFLAMIGATAPAASNCDSQAAPAAQIGVPQPKRMACDPWVQACTPPGGECPACGFHCVRTCSDGCCDCSCW